MQLLDHPLDLLHLAPAELHQVPFALQPEIDEIFVRLEALCLQVFGVDEHVQPSLDEVEHEALCAGRDIGAWEVVGHSPCHGNEVVAYGAMVTRKGVMLVEAIVPDGSCDVLVLTFLLCDEALACNLLHCQPFKLHHNILRLIPR